LRPPLAFVFGIADGKDVGIVGNGGRLYPPGSVGIPRPPSGSVVGTGGRLGSDVETAGGRVGTLTDGT
jgi:hypothetical protein